MRSAECYCGEWFRSHAAYRRHLKACRREQAACCCDVGWRHCPIHQNDNRELESELRWLDARSCGEEPKP